ncbi:prenyltransferase [Pendulispora albinea]|uniref:Prenyltransferase n=1 Tax=Pendulispora albinea TaxID=2741071 RepID=A0ABZ2LPF8_9BACT
MDTATARACAVESQRETNTMLAAKIGTYSRLLKLNVPELSLYPLTTFGLASTYIGEAQYWIVMLTFLLFSLCCGTLTIVLDDVMGYVDGVDQLAVLGEKRNIAKPLLTGELSLWEAKVAAFAIFSLAMSLVVFWLWLAHLPPGTVVLLICALGFVTQYSFGLKLSYRGLGEVVIIFGAAMATALPFLILTGRTTPVVLWTACMNGIPYAAQIVVSNIIDAKSDAASGRRTATVLVGVRRAPVISLVLLSVYWILFAIGLWIGVLPRATLFCLVLLPNHVRFLVRAFAGEYASARLLSFRTVRMQLAVVALSHLLANHVDVLG